MFYITVALLPDLRETQIELTYIGIVAKGLGITVEDHAAILHDITVCGIL